MANNEVSGAANAWDYFDRIFCITVMERSDRRQQAEYQFHRVGLEGKVTFMPARRHPCNSEQGIYESHLNCMSQGLAEGTDHMLIFEDDIIFDRFAPERLDAAVAFLKGRSDWTMFFFGCLVKRSRSTAYPGVVSIHYRSLAHAYAVRSDFAQQLIKRPWQGIPFDAMLAGLNSGFFAAYPAFAFQSDAPSDNLRRLSLDRLRRWCGGFRRIQKANEWTRYHIKLLVVLHVIGIGLLIGIVLSAMK